VEFGGVAEIPFPVVVLTAVTRPTVTVHLFSVKHNTFDIPCVCLVSGNLQDGSLCGRIFKRHEAKELLSLRPG
jgi:hypothetical protein